MVFLLLFFSLPHNLTHTAFGPVTHVDRVFLRRKADLRTPDRLYDPFAQITILPCGEK
jgi:hypothetical protein